MSTPIRVMVLDDEEAIAATLKMRLKRAGFEVVGPFHEPGTALEAANADQVDLGVLDVNLGPSGTSVDVATCLQSKGIPFLFLSGFGASGTDMTDTFPSVPVVGKPVAFANLLESINNLAKS